MTPLLQRARCVFMLTSCDDSLTTYVCVYVFTLTRCDDSHTMHACVHVCVSILTRCDISFTMCACMIVDVATSTHKSSATARVFFFFPRHPERREKRRPSSRARTNILHPLPSLFLLSLPFSPSQGESEKRRKRREGGEGRAPD